MLAPVLALALCFLAALTGTVLMEPVLASYSLPTIALTVLPPLLLIGLLVPPTILSGDWLWMNGKRRSGPPRMQILARLAIVSGLVGFIGPIWFTERPLTDIATSVRALPSAWTQERPDEVATLTPPPDTRPILPTPIDAQFPTAPIDAELPTPPKAAELPTTPLKEAEFPTAPFVLEAHPLRVIDTPTALQLPQAQAGTFFVYEWQDRKGALHWCNMFEEIPPDAKILKATVMKPVEPTAPPAWVTAIPQRKNEPTGFSFMNDPRLPSYAETHWRTQFRNSHSRLTAQERKIAAKQREIDNAPPLASRRSLEEELRTLKAELEDFQREDNDLERDASFRAVPREWRN